MNYPKSNKKGQTPGRLPLRFLSPLHRATRQIQEYFRTRGGRMGGTEGHLVSYLASYGPVPVARLIDVFGVKKSTLTGMLDRLERDGLAKRTLNPDDRRSFLVALTPTGERAADGVRSMLEEFEETLAGELTAADREAFNRVMAAIARVTGTENL